MVFDRVRRILCDQFDINESEIGMETSIGDDLGADSMDSFDLLMAFEEEFDLEIPDEDAEELRLVSDIVTYIENMLDE